MENSLNLRDLLIRIFVIAITSAVLTFVTKNDHFDLHFQLRKAQPTSEKLQVIEISGTENIGEVLRELKKKDVGHIFISHNLYDRPTTKITPYLINETHAKYLSLKLTPDKDGLLRRVSLENQPHFIFSQKYLKTSLSLNLRGEAGSFDSVNFYDLAESDISLDGKLVVVHPKDPLAQYTTPLGLIPEAELVATFIDNAIEHRFIPEGSFSLQFLILAFLLLISILTLIYLPSTLALVATFVFAITYLSLSLWFFDNYYIWTPIANPIIQLVLTLLLISNYKFVLNEKTKWNLEKESLFFNEVEEMKTNFLSLFSHDLKTPLAKIIGITDTLISKNSDPELLRELEKIDHASRDLEKYIKRILKMSQVQSKNISLNKAPEDINTLIEKSIEQNKLSATEKNIKINKQLSPLFMVEIDGSLVQEVIINFIENAITYSPEGSEITISSEENKDFIKVCVSDQGRGIPKQAQDSIWEKYYRFDSQKSGYGLGLFLSRYVIQLHGGRVFLNSKENVGSEFGFVIPIEES